jgi:hypothetical protein
VRTHPPHDALASPRPCPPLSVHVLYVCVYACVCASSQRSFVCIRSVFNAFDAVRHGWAFGVGNETGASERHPPLCNNTSALLTPRTTPRLRPPYLQNGDGSIDRTELLNTMRALGAACSEKDLLIIFKVGMGATEKNEAYPTFFSTATPPPSCTRTPRGPSFGRFESVASSLHCMLVCVLLSGGGGGWGGAGVQVKGKSWELASTFRFFPSINWSCQSCPPARLDRHTMFGPPTSLLLCLPPRSLPTPHCVCATPCQGSDLTHQKKLGFKHFLLCLCLASVLELFPTIHVNDHEEASEAAEGWVQSQLVVVVVVVVGS